MNRSKNTVARGASPQAIQHHYDLSNKFYQLWLDQTMTYSCALWGIDDTLEKAQIRKLDFHLDNCSAFGVDRLLDIGCGWGSLLIRAIDKYQVKSAVGLSLSEAQLNWIRKKKYPGIAVHMESWETHKPTSPYNAIVSIGALEHFVKPELSSAERIEVYRLFFSRCHQLLQEDGWMSLQTIVYGLGEYKDGPISAIFPESDMPKLVELVEAMENFFELELLKNDRLDYAKTSAAWLQNLISHQKKVRRHVSENVFEHYKNYLAAGVYGFESRVFYLLRMRLKRIN